MSGRFTVRAPAATTARADLLQIIGIGAGGVFGGEFDVVDVAPRQFDGGDCLVQHLLPGFLQLVLQMNIAGGDKGVDARALGVFQRLGRAFDIEREARASAATCTQGNSRLTASTASKSPSEAIGKPASRISTPSSTSFAAIRSFSGTVMLQPGDCSPSRRWCRICRRDRSFGTSSSD